MWRAPVLFVLMMVAFASVAPPKQATSDPSQTAEQKITAAAHDAVIEQSHESGEQERPCAQGDDNRASDLCAQWKAADAAKLAANVALWVGIVGSLIGSLTLAAAWAAARWAKKAAVHTEESAVEAKRSADAAEKAVIETQRIGEAQVKCYLSGVSVQLGETSDGKMVVNCTVKNTGHSTARGVQSSAGVSYSVGESNFKLWSERHDELCGRVDIPAGGEEKVTCYLLGDLTDWAVTGATYSVSVNVKLVGKDVFDKPVAESEWFAAHFKERPETTAWIKLKRSPRFHE